MLVARISFTADYDGKRIAIHRERSRVAEDHELARRYPERFEPADDDHGRRRDAYRLVDGRSITDQVRFAQELREGRNGHDG
jgi:hypothetical protein